MSDPSPNLDHIAADLRPLAVPMATLNLDPDNARVGHDLAGIAFSLHKFGQRVPLVVNRSQNNKIEKGNGTYQAAETLKWQYIAAVFVEDDPAAATGFALADNRLAGKSHFDEAALARLLQSIRPQLVPGFSDDEARALIARAKSEHTAATAVAGNNGVVTESAVRPLPAVTTTDDETPAVPEPALGQLYEFDSLSVPGRCHRLVIGDGRDPLVLHRVLNGEQAAAIFTSPPYAEQRSDHYGGVPSYEYVEWWRPIQAAMWQVLADDGSFFLNIRPHAEGGELDTYVYKLVIEMGSMGGWRLIDELCWVRQGFPGRFTNRFKNAHEPVFHFAKRVKCKFRPQNVLKESNLDYATSYGERGMNGNATMGSGYNGQTGRNVKAAGDGALPSNVIIAYTGAHSAGIQYGATFPVALPEFAIKAYSDPDDTWLDPFGGSGTTMEAAEKCGRIACLIDLNPEAARKTFERMGLLGIRPRLVQEETTL